MQLMFFLRSSKKDTTAAVSQWLQEAQNRKLKLIYLLTEKNVWAKQFFNNIRTQEAASQEAIFYHLYSVQN